MEGFLGVIAIIGSILSLILFFKVWGMCNNVSKILRMMEEDREIRRNNEPKSKSQSKKVQPELMINTAINPWKQTMVYYTKRTVPFVYAKIIPIFATLLEKKIEEYELVRQENPRSLLFF